MTDNRYESPRKKRAQLQANANAVKLDTDYDAASSYGAKNALNRFKFNLEHIVNKYDRSFKYESDVIDFRTNEIIRNNGHLLSLPDFSAELLGERLAMPDPIDPSIYNLKPGADEPDDADDVDSDSEEDDEEENANGIEQSNSDDEDEEKNESAEKVDKKQKVCKTTLLI